MNLGQSRVMSFVEAVVNTAVGFVISVTAQWFILSWIMHIKIANSQFVWLSIWMTVLSVVRSFVLRRMFNSEIWKRWKRGKPTRTSNTEPPLHPNCRSVLYTPKLDERTSLADRAAYGVRLPRCQHSATGYQCQLPKGHAGSCQLVSTYRFESESDG